MFGPLALLLGVGALVLAFGSGARGGNGDALKKEYARMQALDAAEVMKVQTLLRKGDLQDMATFQQAIENLKTYGFPAIAAQLEARLAELQKKQQKLAATKAMERPFPG